MGACSVSRNARRGLCREIKRDLSSLSCPLSSLSSRRLSSCPSLPAAGDGGRTSLLYWHRDLSRFPSLSSYGKTFVRGARYLTSFSAVLTPRRAQSRLRQKRRRRHNPRQLRGVGRRAGGPVPSKTETNDSCHTTTCMGSQLRDWLSCTPDSFWWQFVVGRPHHLCLRRSILWLVFMPVGIVDRKGVVCSCERRVLVVTHTHSVPAPASSRPAAGDVFSCQQQARTRPNPMGSRPRCGVS